MDTEKNEQNNISGLGHFVRYLGRILSLLAVIMLFYSNFSTASVSVLGGTFLAGALSFNLLWGLGPLLFGVLEFSLSKTSNKNEKIRRIYNRCLWATLIGGFFATLLSIALRYFFPTNFIIVFSACAATVVLPLLFAIIFNTPEVKNTSRKSINRKNRWTFSILYTLAGLLHEGARINLQSQMFWRILWMSFVGAAFVLIPYFFPMMPLWAIGCLSAPFAHVFISTLFCMFSTMPQFWWKRNLKTSPSPSQNDQNKNDITKGLKLYINGQVVVGIILGIVALGIAVCIPIDILKENIIAGFMDITPIGFTIFAVGLSILFVCLGSLIFLFESKHSDNSQLFPPKPKREEANKERNRNAGGIVEPSFIAALDDAPVAPAADGKKLAPSGKKKPQCTYASPALASAPAIPSGSGEHEEFSVSEQRNMNGDNDDDDERLLSDHRKNKPYEDDQDNNNPSGLTSWADEEANGAGVEEPPPSVTISSQTHPQ